MGIDVNILKFIVTAHRNGVDFTRTIMIGRQRLYVTPAEIDRIVPPRLPNDRPDGPDAEYAEWVLRRLGAEVIDSVDVSPYEGASIVHDMNFPLPTTHHGRYSVVLECGTIEHIFNFPTAICNCMELVAIDGRMLMCTVANNFCGHGFYQFSPELFFRSFKLENGFEVERMVACDAFYESIWWTVADPNMVGQRIEIIGPYPVMLMMQAHKVCSSVPFPTFPQQSDYAPAWSGKATHPDHKSTNRPRRTMRSLIPKWATQWVRSIRSARQYQSAGFSRHPPT